MQRRDPEWQRSILIGAAAAALLALRVAGAGTGGDPLPVVPPGLPPVPVPSDNLVTPAKVALGEKLFFDPGLSSDRHVSCSGCHRPDRYFVDEPPLSKGIVGVEGARNAASLLNAAYSPFLLADGRAKSLEEQVLYPVLNPLEMNTTPEEVVKYVGSEPSYRSYFSQAFGAETVTWERVTQALASFERTLLSGDSAFDRFAAGDAAALSPPALRGWELFRARAGCIRCHSYSPERPFFTDFDFHNTGVAWFPEDPQPGYRLTPDLGRFWVSRDRRHLGAFRTPSLRNVARTAPYMHDGKMATLREVVDSYSRGPVENPFLDKRIRPLGLTESEKADLIAFLESLTGQVNYRPPPANGSGEAQTR
jgi:cytochrome c peroxidase